MTSFLNDADIAKRLIAHDPRVRLLPVAGDGVDAEVKHLALKLDAASETFFRLDNGKRIADREQPVLAHCGTGNWIKIRLFLDEDSAIRYFDTITTSSWPHAAPILGRQGRAVAEAWVDGDFACLGTKDYSRFREAGAALGLLHSTPAAGNTAEIGQQLLYEWFLTASDRIQFLLDRNIINSGMARRLHGTLDGYVPDTLEFGLTHGDFVPEHLIVDSENRLFCIDNESLRGDAVDFDLVRTLVCWRMSRPARQAFLSGYAVHRDPVPAARRLPFWLMAVGTTSLAWQQTHRGTYDQNLLRGLRSFSRPGWFQNLHSLASCDGVSQRCAFGLGDFTAQVYSPDSGLVAWNREFASPQFEVNPDAAGRDMPDWHIEYHPCEAKFDRWVSTPGPESGEETRAFMRDQGWTFVRACGRGRGERLYFDEELQVFYGLQPLSKRIRVYSRPESPLARFAVMRVLRELAMRAATEGGSALIHAAAIASLGKGMLIVGPKGAGKTTLLTYLLLTGAGAYITNDRAILTKTDTGYSVRGLPTIVSVREGTTRLFPVIRRGQETRHFWQLHTLEEARPLPENPAWVESRITSPDLSPAQYRALLGCTAEHGAVASIIVNPIAVSNRDAVPPCGYRITRLENDAALESLQAAKFGPGDGCPGGELVGPGSEAQDRYREDQRKLVKLAASRVPSYRVEIHEAAFATSDLARELLALEGLCVDEAIGIRAV
jgi:hypothetical protein